MKRTSSAAMIGALWLAEITAAYGSSMVYAAMKALVGQFGDPVAVGWLVTAFLLVGSASAAVASRLGDLYGRRRVLLAMLLISGLGLLIGAASASYALVLLSRGLQGLTLAVMPLCFGIVREQMRAERLPLAIGLVISAASAGTLLALVGGGILTDRFGWHGIFAAGAALSFLSFAAVWTLVPATPGHHDGAPTDFLSALLGAPAIAGLLFAISSARSWGWADPRLLVILIFSLALGGLWIRRSLRLANPLIDFRLFARHDVLVINLAYMLIAFGSFQITMIFSLLLQSPVWTGAGLGVAATGAGLAVLPSTALAMLIAPPIGILVARHGGRSVIIWGGLVTVVGWTCAILWHDTVASIAIGMCVMTAGGVTLYAAGPTVLIGAVPPERTSEATGMMVVLRTMAMAAGAQIVAVLLASDTVSNPALGKGSYPTEQAFMLTMAAVALVSVAATLVATALHRRPRRDPPPPSALTA
jgi:MFS family permease